MHLFRDPNAASQDASCPAAPEPGVGGSAAELAAWIEQRPGLVVSAPTMATVGGLSGIQLDVGLKSDWTQACPFANGIPSVPLFNSPAIDHWVVVGNERLRLFLLDLPGGGTVVVDLDAFDRSQVEDLIARSAGIVRSLSFEHLGGTRLGASVAARAVTTGREPDPGRGTSALVPGYEEDRGSRLSSRRRAATCRSSSSTTARPTTRPRSRRPREPR